MQFKTYIHSCFMVYIPFIEEELIYGDIVYNNNISKDYLKYCLLVII